MTPKARFWLGFLLGCAMSGLALSAAGVGHGTYAPMAFNSSFLLWFPDIGVFLALFAAPLLWGAYYGLIPAIGRRWLRAAPITAVLVLHAWPGVELARTDSVYRTASGDITLSVLTHIVVGAVAVLGLILLSRSDGTTRGRITSA